MVALGEDAWPLGRVIRTGLGKATSRGTTGDVYTYRVGRAGIHSDFTAIYKNAEAWYERQTGQDRQSGYGTGLRTAT